MRESKERPIIFNAEMVRAILDGRKTLTRRVMKVQPPSDEFKLSTLACATGDRKNIDKHSWVRMENEYSVAESTDEYFKCPYGYKGDRLWVRETWADVNSEYGPAITYRSDHDIQFWDDFCVDKCEDGSMNYEKYPGSYTMWCADLWSGEEGHGWKPSVHMPRWASRITLEITSVRVEQLQSISEEDAIAEGVDLNAPYPPQDVFMLSGTVSTKNAVMVGTQTLGCGWLSLRGFTMTELKRCPCFTWALDPAVYDRKLMRLAQYTEHHPGCKLFWYDVEVRLKKLVEYEKLVEGIIDDEPCAYDPSGFCQAHCGYKPCFIVAGKQLSRENVRAHKLQCIGTRLESKRELTTNTVGLNYGKYEGEHGSYTYEEWLEIKKRS